MVEATSNMTTLLIILFYGFNQIVLFYKTIEYVCIPLDIDYKYFEDNTHTASAGASCNSRVMKFHSSQLAEFHNL